ncbi:nucleotidyltransferase family protein [Candidatus Pelagibacter sp.]|nr:nucleotidyltransferase family protein [Candidatus Pelagibacter sp.]
MINLKKIKIFKTSLISEALKKISDGGIKIALVVDKKDKLLGTLTDGDIRRGLLRGLDLKSSIEDIFYKNPIIAKTSYPKNETIKLAMSKQVDQIPIVDDQGKIKDIYLLKKFLSPSAKRNKVVLMAGGMGRRLLPLTQNTPKPMLKIGNKPLLHTIVDNFKKSGFSNFIMCLNYKSKVIKNYFGDGKKFGVKIEYLIEKKKMGTIGALSMLKGKFNDALFIMNGDLLTNLDFEKMLDFHVNNNSKATMCVRKYNINLPYGEAKIRNTKLISIVEKPIHKFFVNAGIYILEPECINLVPKKFYDMTLLFKKILAKNKKIITFPLEEYWLDIGRSKDFEKAKLEYKSIFKNT